MAHGVSRGPGSVRVISVSGPRGHEFDTGFSWRSSGRLEVRGWVVLADVVEGYLSLRGGGSDNVGFSEW